MTAAYSYQMGGPPVPADVTGFVVNQVGDTVIFIWDNDDTPGVLGFDLLYSFQDQEIEAAQSLTKVTRATETTTASVPPGDWRFWIRGIDLAGQPSANATFFDLTVVNKNTVIIHRDFVPSYRDIDDDPSFFLRHWTGSLVPRGTLTCDEYSPLSPPDLSDLMLDYVSGGNFDDQTYYFYVTYVTAGGETLVSLEASIFVPSGNLPTAFIPSSAFPVSADGWNVYVDITSGSETQQNITTLGSAENIIFTGGSDASKIDQVWQMPITGLIAGNAQPTQNTTGWEVFNVFVPDPQGIQAFQPDLSDLTYGLMNTGAQANKRAWMTAELIPGPGESGIEVENPGSALNLLTFSDAIVETVYYGFTIGNLANKFVAPSIVAEIKPGNVFFVKSLQVTVDNFPVASAINAQISSAGTTITYSDYGLTYHEIPNLQVTPGLSTSGFATGANATFVTLTQANIRVFDGTTSIGAPANITLTGI